MSHKITIIGLGNYGIDELPLGIFRFLKDQSEVFVRTLDHPVIHDLKSDITFHSFDHIYEENADFETVYQTIVEALIERAQTADVVYAVPGHPRVAETTTQLLQTCAAQRDDVEVEIRGGKSFIDDVFEAVEVDPNDGFTLLDATALTPDQLNIRTHTLITQVYSAMVAADLKITLMERFRDEHEVYIVDGANSTGATCYRVPLYELDYVAERFTNLTSVFIPRVTSPQAYYSDFQHAVQVIDTLVDDEKGCPWDRQQTHDSLKRYLLEETFELFEAIDNKDDWHMVEELGDILLQVLLHSAIGKKEGYFDIAEVVESLNDKMIRRHPHVFGEAEANSIEDLQGIWQSAKAKEGKKSRVKFEKVFADQFLKLYDETKNKALNEEELRQYIEQGGTKA